MKKLNKIVKTVNVLTCMEVLCPGPATISTIPGIATPPGGGAPLGNTGVRAVGVDPGGPARTIPGGMGPRWPMFMGWWEGDKW